MEKEELEPQATLEQNQEQEQKQQSKESHSGDTLINNRNVKLFLSPDNLSYSVEWISEKYPPNIYGFHMLEYKVNNDLLIPIDDVQTVETYKSKQNSLTAYSFLVQLYLDIGHQLMLMKKNGYTTSILEIKDIIVIKNRFVYVSDGIQQGVENFWINDLIMIIIKLLSPEFDISNYSQYSDEEIEVHLDEIKNTPLYHSIKLYMNDGKGFVYL